MVSFKFFKRIKISQLFFAFKISLELYWLYISNKKNKKLYQKKDIDGLKIILKILV